MNEPRSPLLRARSYKSPARCGQRSTDTGAGPAGSRGAPARPGSRGSPQETPTPPRRTPPRLPAAAQVGGDSPAGWTRVGGQGAGRAWVDATDAADATDIPPPSTGPPRPAPPVRWRSRLLAVSKAPAVPPNPSRYPPLRRRPGDRGFRLLLCRWGGNSLQPWSPGQADSQRGQHRLPPRPHPRGSPRRRRRGGGGPVGSGPPPGAVGAHMQDAARRTSTLTVRGGGRRTAPPRAVGTVGDPPRLIPPSCPRPAAPHLPSQRGRSGAAPAGLIPPHLCSRQPRSRPTLPRPPSRRRCTGGPRDVRGAEWGRRGGD
ncbi:basic proline-rich protein-like [Myiozetetes cayanensis]|uniref:basic proline-rich protein-like n=1 Tax=Myiozetetes cayanensis TaxID=478635 RepID=UPI00215F2913|nr:basic proline-rich protein-like [Myiozetetes cayanensis]